MNLPVLTTIAVTGFSVAFLHAAIPTHWLPFVLTGRVQKLSRGKTLLVTALCGSGHVLFTAVLGFLVVWLGFVLNDRIGSWFPRIAGGTLLAFGLFYLYRQFSGTGHSHTHLHSSPDAGGDPAAADSKPATPLKSDRTAIIGLWVLLTFSPCEAFIPVYVSAVRYGWSGFALLTALLCVGSVLGMVVFTWLTLIGLEKLELKWIERYDRGVLGALLCALGLFVMFFEK
jgi:hypothetical protein